MPASLTIQVRLGFSMGWRIWTPNEVGFYAKTLAHSYFILVILKAKFLKEKIWIVNYNLFLGKRKYYIFIEFLKFGMKTKEERSFWRKMIYISIVSRSAKFKKNIFIPRRNRHFRVKLLRKSIQSSFPKRDWKRKWKKVNTAIFKKILPMIKKQHILNIKNMLSGVNRKVYNEEIVDVRNINFIKKKINKYKIFIYNFKLNKKNHKKLLKIEKLNKRKKKNYITNLFFNNNLKCINKSFNGFINDREHSTVYMLQNYEDSSREEDFKMIEYIKKSFSFPRKPSPWKLSIYGGPRKRLSRNLKRSFKGKYIKYVTNLIWFWEKVSRLLSYTIKRMHNNYDSDII